MANDAGIIFVTDFVRVLDVDPEPFHEALITQNVNRWGTWRQVKKRDFCFRGLVAELGSGPLADQFARLEVIGGKGRIGGVDWLKRGIKCNDEQSGITRLFDNRHNRLGVRCGQKDTLRTRCDAGFNRLHLGFMVPIDFTGKSRKVDTIGNRRGLRAFLHFHKEWVDVGFGDKAGTDFIGFGSMRCSGKAKRKRPKGGANKSLLHLFPPRNNLIFSPLGRICSFCDRWNVSLRTSFVPVCCLRHTKCSGLSINKSD